MSSAADVANLEKQGLAQAFLDIEVVIVVVSVSEILADGKEIVDLSADVDGGAQGSRCWKDGITSHDGTARGHRRNGVHWTGAGRITFQAVGGAVGGAII